MSARHLPAARIIESASDAEQDTVCTSLDPVFDMAHADLSVNFFGTDGSDGTGYNGHLIYPHRAVPTEHHRTVGRLADPGRHRVRRRHRSESARCGADGQPTSSTGYWPSGARGDGPPVRPAPHGAGTAGGRAGSCGPDESRCGAAGEDLDYVALHRRSDNLAALLADHGVRPGSVRGAVDAARHRHGGGAGGHREGRRRVLPDRSRLSGGA